MPRKALRATPSTINKSQPYALPPPVGGWNARDALATMPETDAERMDNWFPDTTYVSPRAGSLTYSAGHAGTVTTAMQWAGGTTVKLFVASSGAIVNVATAGSISNTSTIATGYTSDYWQYVNFGAGGGNFLICVNGSDKCQGINGSSASTQNIVFTDSGSSEHFTNVNEYQQRLFFTYSGSLSFYYMQHANAISGTCAPFDLSGLMSDGGELVAMGTWTRDSGNGMDDLAVFISSQGQAAVYSGNDPSQTTSWSLVGVYQIPKPLGRRCVEKFGGDLIILTTLGVLPLGSVVGGPIQEKTFVTDKIRKAFYDAVSFYRNNTGWQVRYIPDANWLVVNIPASFGAEQFVMNTNTGAWCHFTGMNAYCWEVYQNSPIFGTTGLTITANTGTNDNGTNINIDMKQAATVCGLPGRRKKLNLFRPHIKTNGDLPILVGVNMDFDNTAPTSTPTPVPVAYPYWDLATWDTYLWADSAQVITRWFSCGGFGTYFQLRLTGAVNTETIQHFGTDIAFEAGGLI